MSQFENPAPTGEPIQPAEPIQSAEARPSAEPGPSAEPRDPVQQWGQVVPQGAAPVPMASPRGPAPFPIVLGLMCLTVAGLVFTAELSDWDVNWLLVVPVGLVTTGALLVLAGLLGLLANRPGRT